MEEEWRDVEGYKGQYQVNRNGQVKNQKTNEILVPVLASTGYLYVKLKGGRFPQFIHRLVAMSFIPNPNNLPVVNHKDGVKINCKVDNLEWCTHSENTIHAYETGLKKRQKRHPRGNQQTHIFQTERIDPFYGYKLTPHQQKRAITIIRAMLNGRFERGLAQELMDELK